LGIKPHAHGIRHFYIQWKKVGRQQISEETKRERERETGGVLLQKGYSMGNKLDYWKHICDT